jgi:antitoxin HicB
MKTPANEQLPPHTIRKLSDEEGGGYLVEFPDYPGCIADGETPGRAKAEASDALRSYLFTVSETL